MLFITTKYFALQTMSPKEKSKFEDMAKQDKVRYEREMKNYIPPKGEKKKRFKDPNAPKRPPYVQHMHTHSCCTTKKNLMLISWKHLCSLTIQVSIFHFLRRLSPQDQGWESRLDYWRHSQEAWRDVEQLISRGEAALWEEGSQVEREVWQGEASSLW